MPPSLENNRDHVVAPGTIGVPGPSQKNILEDPRNLLNLTDLEKQYEDSHMKLLERARLETDRNGGLYQFSLGDNISPRQFFDPWSVTLTHAPLSETSG